MPLRRLEYDFLAFAFFVPCFLLLFFRFYFLSFLIFFLHPGMFIFLVSLRPCSSHLLISARTYFIVRVLSACCVIVPYPISELFCFYSFRFFFGKLTKSGIPGWFLNKIGYLFFRDGARLRTSAKRLQNCLLYTSPSPRDLSTSRMPSSA